MHFRPIRIRFSFGVTAIALCVIVGCLNAGWWRTYGTEEEDAGYCVEQTSEGGYIVTGSPWTLLKLDDRGNVLWKKEHGFGGHCIHQTSDGGYIVGGDYRMLKTDGFGDTVWIHVFGWQTSWVEQTSDKGFIVTGTETHYSESLTNDLIRLEKLDPEGNTVWSRIFGLQVMDFHSCGFFVQQTSSGGYIISGASDNISPGGWLIRTDNNGLLVWDLPLFNPYIIPYQVRETRDGGFIAVGYGDEDLIKIDSSGAILWTRSYGGGNSIQQTRDRCFIVTGGTSSSGGDLSLIKVDSLGDTVWTRTYGGEESDVGYSVQQTTDGGYIVVGSTRSFGEGKSDIYLLKTDSLGLVAVSEPVTPVTQADWQVSVSVGRQITLRAPEGAEPLNFTVFDASGRMVDEIHLGPSSTVTWPVTHQPPGVYFIKSDGDSSKTSKIVLVK